jgi:hypothetical protein
LNLQDAAPTLFETKFSNKKKNSCNFENDYKIEILAGKSVVLNPLFNSVLTDSLTPIRSTFLNNLGVSVSPTISLVKDSSLQNLDGNYLLDSSAPISEYVFSLSQNIESGTSYSSITFTTIPINMPSSGFLIFGYGTRYQTDPIEFFNKTSSTTLWIDSNHVFEDSIPTGTSVLFAYSAMPLDTVTHSAFLVNTAIIRLYAEALINSIKASGSDVNVNTIYPNDYGLGNSSRDSKVSDAIYIWGTQEDLDKTRQ